MVRNDGIKSLCSRFVEAVEQMPIHIEHGPHRGMTKSRRDGLGVLPGTNQQCNMAVAQIVETAWFSD